MAKVPLKERMKRMLKIYGPIALVIYFLLFAIVYIGFLTTISSGIGSTDTAGTVGAAGAAWLATKVTQPLRIGATLVLTPLVGRLMGKHPLADEPEDTADDDEAVEADEEPDDD